MPNPEPGRVLGRILWGTRAQQQVILVGDVVASTAVEAPLHALMRQVALGAMLDEILDGMA